jgi:hypothetical protein
LALFDDAAIRKIIPAWISTKLVSKARQRTPKTMLALFTYTFAIFTVAISLIQFQLRFTGYVSPLSISIENGVAPLRIVNVYGPFAVITTKRMEIIIEGSNDGFNWREYEFKYKPGDIYRRPPWNIPHQPRLDWQLWFAALSPADNNPWFARFLQRLLENSPEVVALLKTNPFPDKPPYYVRASFYDYHFSNADEKEKTGAWWNRQLAGLYFPEVHLK